MPHSHPYGLEISLSYGNRYSHGVDEAQANDDPLAQILLDKVRPIKANLQKIDSQLAGRSSLSGVVIDMLRTEASMIQNKLLAVEQWPPGESRAIMASRLEKILADFSLAILKEMQQSWKDRSELEKEKRIWFKQYEDEMRKMRIVLQK